MSNWTAKTLMTGYDKCIIGFDLRIPLDICSEKIESKIIQSNDPLSSNRKCVATIDNEIWPEKINEHLTAYQHGLNLLDRPFEKIEGFEFQMDLVHVAFDLPIKLAKTLVSTFGVDIYSIEIIKNKNWKFFGYDIIDARTQCSGMYSFDWSGKEFVDILNQLSLKLNDYGLVDDESCAIKSAIHFDSIIKEHAPFSPCGIWVRKE